MSIEDTEFIQTYASTKTLNQIVLIIGTDAFIPLDKGLFIITLLCKLLMLCSVQLPPPVHSFITDSKMLITRILAVGDREWKTGDCDFLKGLVS